MQATPRQITELAHCELQCLHLMNFDHIACSMLLIAQACGLHVWYDMVLQRCTPMHACSFNSIAPEWARRLAAAASGGLTSPIDHCLPAPVVDQLAWSPQQTSALHWTLHPRLAQASGAALGPATAQRLHLQQQQRAILVTIVYSAST